MAQVNSENSEVDPTTSLVLGFLFFSILVVAAVLQVCALVGVGRSSPLERYRVTCGNNVYIAKNVHMATQFGVPLTDITLVDGRIIESNTACTSERLPDARTDH